MSDKEQPIPSPFSNVKEMRTETSGEDIIRKMRIEYAKMLKAFEKMGIEENEHTITTFTAGFLGAMKTFGFPNEDAEGITTLFVASVAQFGVPECGCDNCKKK